MNDVDIDPELKALGLVNSAFASLSDSDARQRVLDYIIRKFSLVANSGQGVTKPQIEARRGARDATPLPAAEGSGELPGIAQMKPDGTFTLTVRDLKATSANDAARRIVHLAIYANERLTGQSELSSPDVIVPLLKRYRAYDGNTRYALAKDRGLIRNGDLLSLDAHAKQLAEQFEREVLDPEHKGKWPVSGNARRKTQKSDVEGKSKGD